MKKLDSNHQHALIIIAGPTGSGKTKMIRHLRRLFRCLQPSVTYTTRRARKGEGGAEDKIMRFITPKQFRKRIREKKFIEWAIVHGNYYGTDRRELYKRRARGPVILNLDVQGVALVKRRIVDAVTIFILPSPLRAYFRRLTNDRGQEPNFRERIKSIRKELRVAHTFDYIIRNHERELSSTFKKLQKTIRLILGSACS